jgi:aspartyl-tRNA(Asn)/glutamyl-tRNA(Gln) amidotransferase subunit A
MIMRSPWQGPGLLERTPTPSRCNRVHCTVPFTLTGQPAASVPCGFTSAGLSAARQIAGRLHADRLVRHAAAACEPAALFVLP